MQEEAAEKWTSNLVRRITALVEKVDTSKVGGAHAFLLIDSCVSLAELLVEKNTKYGDSVLNPIRVFSKASDREQLLVRLDDKLSRITRGTLDDTEDTVIDAAGYLVLLRIMDRRSKILAKEGVGITRPISVRSDA